MHHQFTDTFWKRFKKSQNPIRGYHPRHIKARKGIRALDCRTLKSSDASPSQPRHQPRNNCTCVVPRSTNNPLWHTQSADAILTGQRGYQFANPRQKVHVLRTVCKRDARKESEKSLRLKLKLLCKLIHTNTASQVAQDELLPVTVKTNGFAEIAEAICERALPLKQTMPLDKTPVQTHFQIWSTSGQFNCGFSTGRIHKEARACDDPLTMGVKNTLIDLGGQPEIVCSHNQLAGGLAQSSKTEVSKCEVQAHTT